MEVDLGPEKWPCPCIDGPFPPPLLLIPLRMEVKRCSPSALTGVFSRPRSMLRVPPLPRRSANLAAWAGSTQLVPSQTLAIGCPARALSTLRVSLISAERPTGSATAFLLVDAKEDLNLSGLAQTWPNRLLGEPSRTVRTSYCRSRWSLRAAMTRDCPYLQSDGSVTRAVRLTTAPFRSHSFLSSMMLASEVSGGGFGGGYFRIGAWKDEVPCGSASGSKVSGAV
mmetsp:Transcript_39519/g.70835  ORF Transcript_39519/g.70835 Transcript_39519/m.70835 type:complete len:225 (+) Transcript_39519:203-877(+)